VRPDVDQVEIRQVDAADGDPPGAGGEALVARRLCGPLGGLLIRKPGASVFVVLVAAVCSALAGNVWGVTTLLYGLAEGLGAEIAFVLVAYKRFGLPVGLLSGVLAGAGEWVSELFTGNMAKTASYNVIYLIANMVSGAILAGLLAWVLVRALAATGVLNRFAAGQAYAKA